jgi:hypothetical protein
MFLSVFSELTLKENNTIGYAESIRFDSLYCDYTLMFLCTSLVSV